MTKEGVEPVIAKGFPTFEIGISTRRSATP